jgi:hypothetical protein
MTADQMTEINKMTFSDIRDEMTSLGIQMPTRSNPNGGPQGSPQDQNGTVEPPSGTPNADNGSGQPGGGMQPQGTPNPQWTPGARGGENRGGGMMIRVFIDPLITMLQTQAGK